jgi:ATP synthase protein I
MSDSDDNFDDRFKNLDDKLKAISKKELEKLEKKQKSDKVKGEMVLAELVAGIVFGLFFGFLIDDYFGTTPLFLIILIILGLAGSFYNIYKNFVVNENSNNIIEEDERKT